MNQPNTVYILSVTTPNSRPDLMPFSNEERLRSHVCELIAKHGLVGMDDKIKRKLIVCLETKDYLEAISVYRHAQLNNSARLGLDFYWTGPHVVL